MDFKLILLLFLAAESSTTSTKLRSLNQRIRSRRHPPPHPAAQLPITIPQHVFHAGFVPILPHQKLKIPVPHRQAKSTKSTVPTQAVRDLDSEESVLPHVVDLQKHLQRSKISQPFRDKLPQQKVISSQILSSGSAVPITELMPIISPVTSESVPGDSLVLGTTLSSKSILPKETTRNISHIVNNDSQEHLLEISKPAKTNQAIIKDKSVNSSLPNIKSSNLHKNISVNIRKSSVESKSSNKSATIGSNRSRPVIPKLYLINKGLREAKSKQSEMINASENNQKQNKTSEKRHFTNSKEQTKERAWPYRNGYAIKDVDSGTDFGHEESSDGQMIRGSYYVSLPDGRTQRVSYHADDHNGFVAEVTYIGRAEYDRR